jgi:hypothetical protein
LPGLGCQTAADRVVHDLLEGLSLSGFLLLEQLGDIWVERHGGSHESIMMLPVVEVNRPLAHQDDDHRRY